jgi:hypothetical protein
MQKKKEKIGNLKKKSNFEKKNKKKRGKVRKKKRKKHCGLPVIHSDLGVGEQ